MTDTLDILTPDEAATAVNIGSATDHDERIGQMVTAISRKIDKLCGPVVQRDVTERLSGGCGTSRLQLRQPPVASVTTLTEYTNATGQLLTAEDEDTFAQHGYLLDGELGTIIRRSSGTTTTFAVGDRNIVAVYVAGRYEDTETVDADWKFGAAEILGEAWKQNSARWARRADFIAGDDEPWGYLAIEDMIRRRFRFELIGPGIW